MSHDPSDTVLQQLEATIFSLILTRIALRGRIRVEEDLRELEELVGRELPEVRAQVEHALGSLTALPDLPPAPRTVHATAFAAAAPGEPGRKGRKQTRPANDAPTA